MIKLFFQSTLMSTLLILNQGAFANMIDNIAVAKETLEISKSLSSLKLMEQDGQCQTNLDAAAQKTKNASSNIYSTQYLLASMDLTQAKYIHLKKSEVKNCMQQGAIKDLVSRIDVVMNMIAGLD